MTKKKLSSSRQRSRPVEKRGKMKTVKKNKLLMGFIVIVIAIIAIAAVYVIYINLPTSDNETDNPIAIMETSMGTIKIELYEDKAPITAGNFIDLANDGYYDGVIFHRVINDFMIQGGDPEGTGRGGHAAKYHEGYGDPNDPETWVIPDEFHEDLSNIRGTISMANSGPDTGGSQFFINVVDNTNLDYDKEPLSSKHAVFGMVIEGMEVADEISELDPEQTSPANKPMFDVVIESITIQ
jgi:cyclophilin family peptidyl-prolyl cis-trans isomerase